MGLDIRVYKNVKITTNQDNYNFKAYVAGEDWNWKIKKLQNRELYIGESLNKNLGYSYSSHNRFRETLIKVIGRTDLLKTNGTIDWEKLPVDLPFNAFIDFSDCEGCLDWEVSEIIYQDFNVWKDKAEQILDEYTFKYYLKWLDIFDSARNNGVVVFS